MRRSTSDWGRRLINLTFVETKKSPSALVDCVSTPTTKSHYRQVLYQQFSSWSRKDPTAKRPNKICDPYGQNGKPLSYVDAAQQLSILDPGWTLCWYDEEDDKGVKKVTGKSATNDTEEEKVLSSPSFTTDGQDETFVAETTRPPPFGLEKEYYHENYMDASKFASIVASVAHNNNHYPKIIMERRLLNKEKAWRVVTTVQCYTEVLGG
eukprot:CAMPEP_0176476388 /NCGR_PEP_ID=MMETSP0200_2-20121128/24_1 /TAXON_ID=947934 /ORGANISM="Chaetoceros sp., Strain GSL56" /LENGTH=208 /DNA_ID=CAMNT_0017872051 /DNA_START=123 /DNA_END=745 /DNA_ORIENTATION=-